MTSRVRQRLAELGLSLPAVAAPVAAYVPAVRAGGLVWTSGQLPFVDGELAASGKVGEQPVGIAIRHLPPNPASPVGAEASVDPETAQRLAAICALNALAAVASVLDLDEVTRVVKVVGYVASAPGFTGQPTVINGASELLGQVFGDAGQHARSAVGVASLPLDSPVEIDLVVAHA